MTYFVVERDFLSTGETKFFDVLASGNGQWGGLGNGTFSNCQGDPVKVKNMSGLMECVLLFFIFCLVLNIKDFGLFR